MPKTGMPRVRCPFCGALAWLKSFQSLYPVEVKIQFMKGGRGCKDFVKYVDLKAPVQLEEMRVFLLRRCHDIIRYLKIHPSVDNKGDFELDYGAVPYAVVYPSSGFDYSSERCLETGMEVEYG